MSGSELAADFADTQSTGGKGESAWMWLYSDRWAEIDNTPGGAGERIRALLDEAVPEAFKEDPKRFFDQNAVDA